MMNPAAGMEKVPAYNTWVNSQVPQATSVLFTGPTSGSNGVASTAFTVAFKGNTSFPYPINFTVADAGTGTAGAFSKTIIHLSQNQTSNTFTYTPGSTGAKVISLTNDAGTSTDGSALVANPSSITYTSS